MDSVKIRLVSNWSHCSQILTGFLKLQEKGIIKTQIVDERNKQNNPYDYAAVLAEYKNLHICYDMMDGYQNIDCMRDLIQWSDCYFKRSFSSYKNSKFFSAYEIEKMHPLGMNYNVTCKGNPYNSGGGKRRFAEN